MLNNVWNTLNESISTKTCRTRTRYSVSNNSTFSICSTNIWTWIGAFVIDARFVTRAICIDNAFWTAIWCFTKITIDALTNWYVSICGTLGIWSTRIWLTRIFSFCYNRFSKNFKTTSEWIARLTCRATAYWAMVYNFAPRIISTSAGAGINAFLVHACFVLRTF